jgi:hypothetical protein
MKADDVKRSVDTAIKKAKLITKQKPKLLSDNSSCYIATELKSYLKDSYQMDQIQEDQIIRKHREKLNAITEL